MSFSEIKKELKINKIKLNFHLKNLFSSALIDHYYRHEVGNPRYSFYSITSLGKRVLFSLLRAFIPPPPVVGYFGQEAHTQSFTTEYVPDAYLNNLASEVFCRLEEKAVCSLITDTGGSAISIPHNSVNSLGEYVTT